MEYAHRLLGRLIGIWFFLPLVYFWIKGMMLPVIKKMSLCALVLGAGQGIMGWYMVKSGLVKDPAVSHYRLAVHLLLAIILYLMILWMGLKVIYPFPASSLSKLKPLVRALNLGLILILLTLFTGHLLPD